MVTSILWFLLGLVILVGGAELLVRGASRFALALGISPLVIGLTVVAFGTSAPELSVSVNAALQGQAELAIGNVVGSNVFNILLILGLSAVVTPLVVDQKLVRLEVPLMIGTSVLVLGMALDGKVGPGEGSVLLAGLLLYTVFLVVRGRRESPQVEAEYAEGVGTMRPLFRSIWLQLLLIVAGLVLLVAGSDLLLDSSVTLARMMGISELVIGLTLVAGGTSLPELATSMLAAFQGKRDIAVGNVVGSNLFNILCVLGLTAVVSGGVPVGHQSQVFDIPVMIAASLLCLPVFLTARRISRGEGFLLLAGYVLYLACLYAMSSQ